jgi:hypothetical protein
MKRKMKRRFLKVSKNPLLQNNQGVALMMVLTSITILSALMIQFSFDTKIDKLRVLDLLDKKQAKLNAESGLHFAMIRLELYQKAFNTVEKDSDIAQAVPKEVLNYLWNFPFIYPIPVTKDMGLIEKDMIEKFHDTTLLDGEMKLSIQNISHTLNLNLLRLAAIKDPSTVGLNRNNNNELSDDGDDNEDNEDNENSEDENRNNNQTSDGDEDNEKLNFENEVIKFLKNAVEVKGIEDESFYARYNGTDIEKLVKIITYYISDENQIQDPGEIPRFFEAIELAPKHAPLMSASELYLLPEWTDELISLIKNEYTVYGAVMIDLNKITKSMLKFIFPNIDEEQSKNFFLYRDNPEDPKTFSSLNSFKNYIVTKAKIMSDDEFTKRIAIFEKAGIKFGPSPTLFKIISAGSKNRVNYTIEAIVSLPAKPILKDKKKKKKRRNNKEPIYDSEGNEILDENDEEEEGDSEASTGEGNEETENNESNGKNKSKKGSVELLKPRIIEIYIN